METHQLTNLAFSLVFSSFVENFNAMNIFNQKKVPAEILNQLNYVQGLPGIPIKKESINILEQLGGITRESVIELIKETGTGADVDLSEYAKLKDIPDVSSFVTPQFVIDSVSNKVDKIQGKGLSTEDYTAEDKVKVRGIETLEDTLYNLEFFVYDALTFKVDRSELNSFASKIYVDQKIADIPQVDLSEYDKTKDVDSKISIIEDKKADKSDLDVYELTTSVDSKLRSKADITYVDSVTQVPKMYNQEGPITQIPKIWSGVATAKDGVWSIDYSSAGFTKVESVVAIGCTINDGTSAGDGRYVTLIRSSITTTGCSGKLNSASSAGLLAAMVNVHADGEVMVTVYGY